MANTFADFAKATPLPASRLGAVPAINATIERVGTILPTLGNMGPDAAKAFACSTCYLAIKNATADGAKLDMNSLYTSPEPVKKAPDAVADAAPKSAGSGVKVAVDMKAPSPFSNIG